MPPRYREITADQIPEVDLSNGVRIRVIAGVIGDIRGPIDDIAIDPEYLDCTVPACETYRHSTLPTYTALIYVIGGKGNRRTEITNGTLVIYDDGEQLRVQAADEEVRFLLFTGKPLNEPVAWRGPIVMNTEMELETAFREYREGTFIKI